MRVKWTVLIILLSFGLPGIMAEAELNGASRMYLQVRESADDLHLLPLFEYLDFSLDDFQNEALTAAPKGLPDPAQDRRPDQSGPVPEMSWP